MTREIINIQAGQAGNQIGEAFWAEALEEHGLNQEGMYVGSTPDEHLLRAGVYFDEILSDGKPKYVPRSVQVDLEDGVLHRIKAGPCGRLFRPDTFVSGTTSAGNNWAKGFYTEGAELVDSILDITRRQAEPCDSLQGTPSCQSVYAMAKDFYHMSCFQIIHSLGGGTGAGLGSLLLSKLREEYPDRMLSTFSVLPSPKVSDTVVEPYNAMLSLNQLLENSDMVFCLDNEAMYDIAVRTLKVKTPDFPQLNSMVAKVMCGVSTSLRFSGQLNGDLLKMAINVIPFPRLHFLIPTYAPFYDPSARKFQGTSIPELTKALFDRKNFLAACDPRFGRYLTVATIFRGKISSRDVEISVRDLQQKNSSLFVEWIPDNVSVSLCSVPPVGQPQAAIGILNSTAVQEVFKRNLDQFTAMYNRRAFIHWYKEEGMDEQEFSEAQFNVQDLISEYQQYQEATADDDDERYEEQFEEEPVEE